MASPWIASPYRSLNGGSVVLSLLLALFAVGCVAALSLEAAAAGRGPRLAGDLPLLAVHIHGRGFTLLGADEALPDRAFARVPCLDLRCEDASSYDFEGLTARLARAKDRWPRQETLILLPGASVPSQVITGAVDASTADRRRAHAGQPARMLFPDVRVTRSRRR